MEVGESFTILVNQKWNKRIRARSIVYFNWNVQNNHPISVISLLLWRATYQSCSNPQKGKKSM